MDVVHGWVGQSGRIFWVDGGRWIFLMDEWKWVRVGGSIFWVGGGHFLWVVGSGGSNILGGWGWVNIFYG